MELLKQLRIGNHLTQEELGNLLHVSQQTVQKWESGKSNIPIAYHKELSKLFRVDIDFFKYELSDEDIDYFNSQEIMKQNIETINNAKSFIIFCKIYSNRKKIKHGIISNGVDIFKFTSIIVTSKKKAVLFEDNNQNCVPLISTDILEVRHLSGEFDIQHFEIKIKVPIFPDALSSESDTLHTINIAFFYD